MVKDLKKQEAEIMEMAEKSGVKGNFFFRTTFERYLKHLDILKKQGANLDNVVNSKDVNFTDKDTMALIKQNNATHDSINKTINSILKIIKVFGLEDTKEEDPLMIAINGNEID